MFSLKLLMRHSVITAAARDTVPILSCLPISTSSILHKKMKKVPNKNFPEVYLKGTAEFIRRQLSDPYVKRRRLENYRCRSAFKLIEINEKYKILKEGSIVIDLGAAPGSWSQVAKEHIGDKSGLIIGIDLLHIPIIEGVHFIQGDFTDSSVQERITKLIKEQSNSYSADVVLCDAAPKASGIKAIDQDSIIILVSSAISVAFKHLKQGGSLLFKLFHGNKSGDLVRSIQLYFQQVKTIKPDASRKESSEYYVLCLGFRSSRR